MAKYKDKWATLSQSEKRTLLIGGAALVIILLYLVIWSPFMARVANLRKHVTILQKSLVWIQQADKELSKTRPALPAKTGLQTPAALLSFLQLQLEQEGLKEAASQIKQSSQDAVSLQFKEVNFDKLISFMLDVINKRNIQIRQVNVRALSTPGMVDAQIIFVLAS